MASTELPTSVHNVFDPQNKLMYPGTTEGVTTLRTGGGTLSATATAAGDASDYTITAGVGGVNTSTGSGGAGADFVLYSGTGGAVSGAGTSGRGGLFIATAGDAGAAAAGTVGAHGGVKLRAGGGIHLYAPADVAGFLPAGSSGVLAPGDVQLDPVVIAAHADYMRQGYVSIIANANTITLPVSAGMLAMFPSLAIGDVMHFYAFNNAGAGNLIIAAGAGGTDRSNVAGRTLALDTAGMFGIRFTALTGDYDLWRFG